MLDEPGHSTRPSAAVYNARELAGRGPAANDTDERVRACDNGFFFSVLTHPVDARQ